MALLPISSDIAIYRKSNTADAKPESAIISILHHEKTLQGKSTVFFGEYARSKSQQ
jgi:hypothetical protein